MFGFLKRFFQSMMGKAPSSFEESGERLAEQTGPERAGGESLLPEAMPPVMRVSAIPVEVAPPAPAPVLPDPVAAAAPATITDAFLRGSVFDEDEEEEVLPGDKPNLGMVRSIGNPNAYMIGLVGEEDHREAVNDLTEGMAITLELEPGHTQDPSAIAAVDRYGRVIGYVSPDSWLREAVYGGGSGFSAWVLAVEQGDRGYREVVLEVEPSDQPLRERPYLG